MFRSNRNTLFRWNTLLHRNTLFRSQHNSVKDVPGRRAPGFDQMPSIQQRSSARAEEPIGHPEILALSVLVEIRDAALAQIGSEGDRVANCDLGEGDMIPGNLSQPLENLGGRFQLRGCHDGIR